MSSIDTTLPGKDSVGPRFRLAINRRELLLIPVAVFYGFLLVWPVVEVLRGGLGDFGQNWQTLHGNPVLWPVVETTLMVGAVTTLISTGLAYFLAFVAWRSGTTGRLVVFAFVLLPFWTGVLVKNFAWTEILQTQGVVNKVLTGLGVVDQPLSLLHNRFAVIVGMVHYCVPYAVFPIFAAMISLDPRLEQAARSLGAGRVRVARYVIAPLTFPGVLAASLLVFIISIGFFITPVVLGGPRDQMVSNLIEYYEIQVVNFNVASLLALLVTAAVMALVLIYQRIPNESQYGSG